MPKLAALALGRRGEVAHSARKTLVIIALCVVAGAAIWSWRDLLERKKEEKSGARLLDVFVPREGRTGDQLMKEAAAEIELSRTGRHARAAFLRRALIAENVPKIEGREQPLSVSLSQVRSSDAYFLFKEVIRPVLENAKSSAVVAECANFMLRWSIEGALSRTETQHLTARMVERLLGAGNEDMANAIASVIASLAPGVDPAAAANLVARILANQEHRRNKYFDYAAFPALEALERQVDARDAERFARKLTSLAVEEQEQSELRVLILELNALENNISVPAVDVIASNLSDRIDRELKVNSLASLVLGLAPLKGKINSDVADQISLQLARRMAVEVSTDDLDPLLGAWGVVAAGTSAAKTPELIDILAQGMKLATDAAVINRLAAASAVLKDKIPETRAHGIAAQLNERLRSETNPNVMADLVSGLALFKEKLDPADASVAASILVQRMLKEHDPATIGMLAQPLDDLDEYLTKSKCSELAELMVSQLVSEQNAARILVLAQGFLTVAEHAEDDVSRRLATRIIARTKAEVRPDVLRTFAFSVGIFSDALAPQIIHQAAEVLIVAMSHETDVPALRSLTAGIHALKKVSDGDLQKAGSILLARVRQQTGPNDLVSLSEDLDELGKGSSIENFNAVASNLTDRILLASDADDIRELGRGLATIRDDCENQTLLRLSTRLIARIRAETNPGRLAALADAAGSLPAQPSEYDSLTRIFMMPNAPCETFLDPHDMNSLVRRILNPLCSESSWVRTVAVFNDALKDSIVEGAEKPGPDADERADFLTLIVKDDEDDDSPKGAGKEDKPFKLDFNRLSHAIDPLRK